jgi:hypothetical protein
LVYWDSSPILLTNSKLDNVQKKFVLVLFCLFGIAPLPTNQRQHLFYQYKNTLCSACNLQEETIKHMLQCQGCEKRNIIRNVYNKQLQHYLDKFRIQPSINNVIIQHAWIENRIPPSTSEIEPNASHQLINTINLQNKIGWNNWFTGLLKLGIFIQLQT